MGSTCSGEDDFEGTNLYGNITPQTEQFYEGSVPIVNQIDVKSGKDQLQMGLTQSKPYILCENVDFEVKADVQQNFNLQCISQDRTKLALLVQVTTQELQLQNQLGGVCNRPGIDLICVIDHSGSMSGEKIHLVKRTLKHMLEFLKDNDRLCLIQFDCRLMRVTQENKQKFRIAIQTLQARGGTNIENGMHMAFSILKHRRYKNQVSAIFLLSDGVDEGGEERVRDSLNRASIKDPFTIKTFGFGSDVCPKLMSEIAHYKEGQFYFVPDLSKIDECFVEALGGLVSVIADNLRITVSAPDGGNAKIIKAYGDKWQQNGWNGTYSLYQPHLLSGVSKNFVFELSLPQQGHTLVTVNLTCDSMEKQQHTITKTTQVNALNQDNSDRQDVQANYMRVKGAEGFKNALQHAENGNLQQGQQVLDDALYQMMKQSQGQDDPAVQMVKADLQQAKSQMGNNMYGDYQQGGRHQLMQMHMVHMYEKSRGVQINNGNQEIDCAYQNNVQRAFKDQTRQMKNDPNYVNK